MNELQIVILAGAISPSPLRQAVNRPLACLPLDSNTTVLQAWLRKLRGIAGMMDIIIATNEDEELSRLRNHASQSMISMGDDVDIRVIRDPSNWRGSAGVLRDLRDTFALPEAPVLVIECACLPPDDLTPLVNLVTNGTMVGIGATANEAPAGVYACRADAIDYIPDVGYCDFKEQLIPRLREKNNLIKRAVIAEELIRVHDLNSYIKAARCWAKHKCASDGVVDTETKIRKLGISIVEADAQIECDVILHDTIVLGSAVIKSGSVVSQSIITDGAIVEGNQRIVRSIVNGKKLKHAPRTGINRTRESRKVMS